MAELEAVKSVSLEELMVTTLAMGRRGHKATD